MCTTHAKIKDAQLSLTLEHAYTTFLVETFFSLNVSTAPPARSTTYTDDAKDTVFSRASHIGIVSSEAHALTHRHGQP